MAYYEHYGQQQQQQQQQQQPLLQPQPHHHHQQIPQHPQHLQQFHHIQQPVYNAPDIRTSLWMGELEPWMDENWIRGVWLNVGEQVSVKMIRDKYTGASAGYCFVELANSAAAIKAINSLNGVFIPGTNKPFKLNWATGGGVTSSSGSSPGPEYSVFVGDLSPDVTELMLVSKFQERYVSCRSAKIMTDPTTGTSRGYGFVRFSDEHEQIRALNEMQGTFCGSRPIRISMATPKSKISSMNNSSPGSLGAVGGMGSIGTMNLNANMGMTSSTYGFSSPLQSGSPQHSASQPNDPNNTTVFVGGLSGTCHEDELRSCFAMFGDITYVKIPPGKGCGFVQFVHRQSAEMAINQMNGYQIGNSRVRLSWGRAQSENKRPMSPHNGSSVVGTPGFRSPIGTQYQGIPANNRISAQYGSLPGMMVGAPPSFGMIQVPTSRDPLERSQTDHQTRSYNERNEAIMDRMDDNIGWRGSGAIYA